MSAETDLVTVYRSADTNAAEDAQEMLSVLSSAGLHPRIAGDDEPGVVAGAFEVRVPFQEAEEAENLVRQTPEPEDVPEMLDTSEELDLVTAASTDGTTGEMEAQAIQSILVSNGIQSVIIGSTTLPNFGFEVRVAREHLEEAQRVITEAEAAGPAAAFEAEQAGEGTIL